MADGGADDANSARLGEDVAEARAIQGVVAGKSGIAGRRRTGCRVEFEWQRDVNWLDEGGRMPGN